MFVVAWIGLAFLLEFVMMAGLYAFCILCDWHAARLSRRKRGKK